MRDRGTRKQANPILIITGTANGRPNHGQLNTAVRSRTMKETSIGGLNRRERDCCRHRLRPKGAASEQASKQARQESKQNIQLSLARFFCPQKPKKKSFPLPRLFSNPSLAFSHYRKRKIPRHPHHHHTSPLFLFPLEYISNVSINALFLHSTVSFILSFFGLHIPHPYPLKSPR